MTLKGIRKTAWQRSFTLLELLVVISIIALLTAVLLPGLRMARESARAVKCEANLRSIGQAMAAYVQNKDLYPPSYALADDDQGNWSARHATGPDAPDFGYVHWSWMLYRGERVPPTAFQCPDLPNGGGPRANPGSGTADWQTPQVDEHGNVQAAAGLIRDKQAPWIAYTANAAIMPRNKFTSDSAAGELRQNILVVQWSIAEPGSTILMTEFDRNWMTAAEARNGSYLSRSHWPVSPLASASRGIGDGLYGLEPGTSDLRYGNGAADYGLLPAAQAEDTPELITGKNGSEINAVGRHHPLSQTTRHAANMGEGTNFLYCDGHVARKSVMETLENREWGDHFYSLTGTNDVK